MNGLSKTTSTLIEKLKNGYKSKNSEPEKEKQGIATATMGRGYTAMADDLLDEYLNRDDFSYDVNTDKLYSQYADKAKRMGSAAMRDTVARASELSGGYSNSYAENAGMQAYTEHLDSLSDIIPELEERAYERYLDEEKGYGEKLAAILDLDENEYKKSRDELEDSLKEREFLWDQYRYREDADMDMYKALSDYVLELAKLEGNEYLELEKLGLEKYLGLEELNLDKYLAQLDYELGLKEYNLEADKSLFDLYVDLLKIKNSK